MSSSSDLEAKGIIKTRLIYQRNGKALVVLDTSFGDSQIITPAKLRSLAKQLIAIANKADCHQHLDYEVCVRSY